MNRIVLIGNGFDLAHGLKTSYANFIEWYWGKWGNKLLHSDNKVERDQLCSFKLNDALNLGMWFYAWQGYYYKRGNPSLPWDVQEVAELAKQDRNLCDFTITSVFFQEICSDLEKKGWVDIENVFYSYLSAGVIEPKVINDDLDYLRQKLVECLSDIQKGITEDAIKEGIKEKINAPFDENDIAVSALEQWPDIKMQFERNHYTKSQSFPEKTLLLTFNYTNTADLYQKHVNNCTVNHIHGTLSDPNSVIFGYGDELDEHYKSIVNKNDNEYLRNIKSIKYLEAQNYRDLLEFIETSPYQIFIMGHSCGNSDRTLLNTLFEHKNCISIKPFYYKKGDGSDNHLDLVQNISRNFTDMKLMRDRVVNKTFCTEL